MVKKEKNCHEIYKSTKDRYNNQGAPLNEEQKEMLRVLTDDWPDALELHPNQTKNFEAHKMKKR